MLPLKPGALGPAASSGRRKTSRLSIVIFFKSMRRVSDGRGGGWEGVSGKENLERIEDYSIVGQVGK